MSAPRPWEVWWIDFDPQVGHEQAGRRPAVVVNTALGCRISNHLVTVVPVTRTDRHFQWQPAIVIGDTPSYALCDQVTTVDLKRLANRMNGVRLTHSEIEEIKFALLSILDLALRSVEG